MAQTENRTIVVTGCAGYTGNHAWRPVAQVGHTPVAYENRVCGKSVPHRLSEF